MNYTITGNPYKDSSVVAYTRGVSTDAKVAKLNNDTKRPQVVARWEAMRPQEVLAPAQPVVKDYGQVLNGIGISAVEYAKAANNSGAKKLRVNSIVNERSRDVYNSVDKVVIEVPKAEIHEESPLAPNIVETPEDIHGRHEKTGEIPVAEIKEVQEKEQSNNIVSFPTRAERTIASEPVSKPEVKPESSKAGDIDLYNNLLHNVSVENDLSHQLQGARDKLSAVKAQSSQLAEAYAQAFRDYEQLQKEVAERKAQQEQVAKEELSITLNNIKKIEDENLAKTSDLTSLRSKIEELKAEKQALEAREFESSHGMRNAA